LYGIWVLEVASSNSSVTLEGLFDFFVMTAFSVHFILSSQPKSDVLPGIYGGYKIVIEIVKYFYKNIQLFIENVSSYVILNLSLQDFLLHCVESKYNLG
jgi:hypothetical protein